MDLYQVNAKAKHILLWTLFEEECSKVHVQRRYWRR